MASFRYRRKPDSIDAKAILNGLNIVPTKLSGRASTRRRVRGVK